MQTNGLRERVNGLAEQVARLWADKASRESVKHLVDDVTEIKSDIARIMELFETRAKERQEEGLRAARERKTDRHWMIGTALVAAGLIIAAIAILVPLLTNSGAT